MPSNSWRMSRMESIATPAIPTSPCTRGMVGVVAAVGGQVERHRQALLSRREVAAVEGVGVRGGGEAGVLADGPRLVDVHRRIRPTHVRRFARKAVQRIALRDRGVAVGGDVDRLDVDALGGDPVELVRRVAVRRGGRGDVLGDRGFGGGFAAALAVQRDVAEAADDGGAEPSSLGPQSGEKGRQGVDRVDLGGQVVVGSVRRVRDGLLGPGQVDVGHPGLYGRPRRRRPRRFRSGRRCRRSPRRLGSRPVRNHLRHTGGVDGARVDGLDPAGGQQVGGERRTDVVLGERAEWKQQHLRPRPGSSPGRRRSDPAAPRTRPRSARRRCANRLAAEAVPRDQGTR